MKRLLVVLLAATVSMAGAQVSAQSTSTDADAAKAAKDKKKQDYAAKQKAMQDASKSSASGPMGGASTDTTTPKSRPTGSSAMQSQMDMQANKPSKPVDKNAKGAPRPNASKMTQEERDAYRKDVVKDAKP